MKKFLLLTLAVLFTFGLANAQYTVNYGNSDGSVLSVGIDRDIEIQAWCATDPVNMEDSVTFAHMPLATDNLYVASRNGGLIDYFFSKPNPADPGCEWDDITFLAPDNNMPIAGWTSQSILGFAYLSDPRCPESFLFSPGVKVLLGTYYMHTVNNPGLIGLTVIAMQNGLNPANGGPLWGMQDGLTSVVPVATFSDFFFSPNDDPVFDTAFPAEIDACVGLEVSFAVAGHDINAGNIVTVTPSVGSFVDNDPADETVDGVWTNTFGAAGVFVVTFTMDDANGGVAVGELTVNVATPVEALYIPCPTAAVPGTDVWVPIYLNTNCMLTGGFELLISADPTVLTPFEIFWEARINNGAEYHNWVHNAEGAGTDRLVWIADINNGIPGTPAPTGDSPIVWVHYSVAPGDFLFDTQVPVDFVVNDYTDNTISDETGYDLVWPELTNGCVFISNPAEFKGDPNMNCYTYEIADAVLVARRLIEGPSVWAEDDGMANEPGCTLHYPGNDALQESASDLNDNGFTDVADLVRFINIINGYIMPPPPKVDPAGSVVNVTMTDVVSDNMTVNVSAGVELGAMLVKINHEGVEFGTPVANGMQVLAHDANGVLSVLVYSLAADRIAAGNNVLFTIPVTGNGTMTFAEVSASDSYGRLLDASAHLVAPLPTQIAVHQNYPNPFNAKTMIKFDLPTSSDVSINIYSITGQLVETINGNFEAGYQSVVWDASSVSSGVYFYKVSANDFSQTFKMTLLK